MGCEKEHYSVSMKIGGMQLFPEAQGASAALAAVVTPGISRRAQVREGIGAGALHPPIFLVECLWGT